MATRFYLPSTGAAPISPTATATWDVTASMTRRPCYTTKQGSGMLTVSYDDSDFTDQDIVLMQYISEPLSAQTIAAQTVTVCIRCLEVSTSCNLFLAVVIRTLSNDGTVVRGTNLALTRDGTELSASFISRVLSATTTEVIASANDRLCIEIGAGGDPAGTSLNAHDHSLRIGDAAASDLAGLDGESTDLNPFVEFANTLTFAGTGSSIAAISAGYGVRGVMR